MINVKKSINRLEYLITKGNKPNQADADALYDISLYVEQERKRQLNNHKLFAKIYISVFKSEILRTDGNYQMVADNLRSIVKKPLEQIYDEFHQQMNETEFSIIGKRLGLSDKHPALRTPQENENDKIIISENSNNIAKSLSHYNKVDVYKRLNSLLNNIIDDYEI
tara:strand:- start:477 stop:974 length:498 start_codon:yes stop_codon:yes gene_type:complete